jgi:sarcosine oxidase subunit beta
MKTTADVVVIGAGIQGLSAAYHLAKMGIRDVVVVEKAFIGAGASGRSASMLMLQVSSEWQIGFSLYCFERYMTFQEEFGTDPGYRRIGTFMPILPTHAEHERELVDLRRHFNIETEIWTPAEIKSHFPMMRVDDLAFGVFGNLDGTLDAHAIMLGYKDGATRLGAEIDRNICATGITLSGNRVASVQTTHGDIATRYVVNAAGADAAEVGAWVGIDLPIEPRLRNIYVTDAFPQIPDDTPFVYDTAAEWYYRKEGHGVLFGMGKRQAAEAPMSIDWAFLPQVIEVATHRIPILAEARVASGWTGLRPLSRDGRPILGGVDGIEGYINSCGWGGEGIMHSPIGGQLAAELIHDGKTSTFDIQDFLYARFAQ